MIENSLISVQSDRSMTGREGELALIMFELLNCTAFLRSTSLLVKALTGTMDRTCDRCIPATSHSLISLERQGDTEQMGKVKLLTFNSRFELFQQPRRPVTRQTMVRE